MKTNLIKLIIPVMLVALLAGCGRSTTSTDNAQKVDPKTIPGSVASGGSKGTP